MSNRNISYFLLIFFLSFSAYLKGQTLHAIVFADDGNRDSRQKDRLAEMSNIKQMMNNIAYYTGLKLNLRFHTGSSFNKNYVDYELSDISIGEKDVVFFYYNGHGGNEYVDKWPSISLNEGGLYSLFKIHQYLYDSDAKLVLCVASCCNSYIGRDELLGAPLSYGTGEVADLFQNYKKLFLNFQGKKRVIMSSSRQGQYSYSATEAGYSYFGKSFREALYKSVNEGNASWNELCNDAKRLTEAEVPQNPQYEVSKIEESEQQNTNEIQVNNISVEISHDEYENGILGMRIIPKIDFAQAKEIDIRVSAYFYLESGGKLMDFNGKYRTSNDQVSTGKDVTITSNTISAKPSLFIPYSELHLSNSKKHELKLFVNVWEGAKSIVESDWIYFNYDSRPYDKIYFKNRCDHSIRLLVRLKDLNDNWVTKGWFVLEAGENAYVEDTRNKILYFYAEYEEGKWSGNHEIEFKGETYYLKKWEIKSTNYEIQQKIFSCGN